MPEDLREMEEIQMRRKLMEKDILGQMADLLAREQLINPEERIRFLDCLRKENS